MKVNGETSNRVQYDIQNSNLNPDEHNSTAIIAYITFIGWIIALVKNKEEKNAFASFHIRQMLGICCVGLVVVILAFIPKFGIFINFFGMLIVIVLWVLGLISAVNGERKKVLVLGTFFQEWFKGVS